MYLHDLQNLVKAIADGGGEYITVGIHSMMLLEIFLKKI